MNSLHGMKIFDGSENDDDAMYDDVVEDSNGIVNNGMDSGESIGPI